MTPDGISSEDWGRVRELACEIVNLSGEERYEASEQATHELLDLLVELQQKYGPLPSLLATQADYVESESEREHLLHAAYREAEMKGDVGNQTWIAHSLASHYIDGVPNDPEGERWLSIAEERLCTFADEDAADDLARLRAILSARRRRTLRHRTTGRRTRG